MKKRIIEIIAFVIGIWGFANFAYWASNQPQRSWVFDVNASMFAVVWACGLFALLIWIAFGWIED